MGMALAYINRVFRQFVYCYDRRMAAWNDIKSTLELVPTCRSSSQLCTSGVKPQHLPTYNVVRWARQSSTHRLAKVR